MRADRYTVLFGPVVRDFVALLPCVHVLSLLCETPGRQRYEPSTPGQRKASRAHRALPEQGGSAGSFECRPRNRSRPEKRVGDAGPAPVKEGDQARDDNGE